jgi:hypothetical protein
MQRFHQFVFVVALLVLNWLAMMAVHEVGHVLGAVLTGGSVERVVLYPLTISSTDVSPNPYPATVVWMGPIVGSVLPLAVLAVVPQGFIVLRNVARFFAGFCLIANGAYISLGWIDRVGDCGEMLRTGTPIWVMVAFGGAAIPLGLFLWHGLGSIKQFVERPSLVTRCMAYTTVGVLCALVAVQLVFSPR